LPYTITPFPHVKSAGKKGGVTGTNTLLPNQYITAFDKPQQAKASAKKPSPTGGGFVMSAKSERKM